MSMSHNASNLALHNRVCSIPEGGILFPFDSGLHGIDSAGNIIYPEEDAVATLRSGEGRFGGAVAVEEGTTNLFTNPKLLNNGQDWVRNSSTAWVDSSGEYPYIHGEAQYDGVYQTLSLSATTYTLTYLVKHKSGSNQIGSHFDGAPTMNVRVDGGGWINGNIIDVPSDGNWHLVEIQATYTTAGSYGVYLQPGRAVVGVSEFWFKYAQLEQKPFATSFVNGTRARGALHYDGNQFSVGANEGTFSMWMYVDVSIPRGGGYPTYPQQCGLEFESGSLWCRSYYSTQFDLLAYISNVRYTSVGGEITKTGWHLWTATWSDGAASIYIDGSKVGSKVLGDYIPSGRLRKLSVGCNSNPAVPGSLFDEVLILPYAATDEEIKAWYHSNAPMYNNADTYITL